MDESVNRCACGSWIYATNACEVCKKASQESA